MRSEVSIDRGLGKLGSRGRTNRLYPVSIPGFSIQVEISHCGNTQKAAVVIVDLAAPCRRAPPPSGTRAVPLCVVSYLSKPASLSAEWMKQPVEIRLPLASWSTTTPVEVK